MPTDPSIKDRTIFVTFPETEQIPTVYRGKSFQVRYDGEFSIDGSVLAGAAADYVASQVNDLEHRSRRVTKASEEAFAEMFEGGRSRR
ncbi:MAG TPA: hypothetical protein VJA47_02535 [archaeon]|nr:hypothetical protein [archaeon]